MRPYAAITIESCWEIPQKPPFHVQRKTIDTDLVSHKLSVTLNECYCNCQFLIRQTSCTQSGACPHLSVFVVVASAGLEAGHEGLVQGARLHPAIGGGRCAAEVLGAVRLAGARSLARQGLLVGAEPGLRLSGVEGGPLCTMGWS